MTSIGFTENGVSYIDDNVLNGIISDTKLEPNFIIDNLIIDYLNNHIDSVYNIDLDTLAEYEYLDISFNSFIKIPILLFILRYYYKKFIEEK